MLKVRICLIYLLVLSAVAHTQSQTAAQVRSAGGTPGAGRLPAKRVVLYKNGVGYFEHRGRVSGNQDVVISFTSSQLNDVLKSLTILDQGGGRISGVTYGSQAPIERRLGELALPAGAATTLAEFLRTLRGARLEVRAGTATIVGRLLSMERKTRATSAISLEVDYLSLVTDAGEIRSVEFTPDLAVRILDRGLSDQIHQYLGVLSSSRDADLRRMVISATGSGDRLLSVSYISEVPVWKTTYRLVLPTDSGEKPLLQGWAVVDNTVGEDWEDVELALVAGAPHSFVQQLAQPYFSRRPEVPLPANVSVAPQTHQSTLFAGSARVTGSVRDAAGAAVPGARVRAYDQSNALVGSAETNSSGVYELATLPERALRVEVESPGFAKAVIPALLPSNTRPSRADVALQAGSAAESLSVTASAPSIQTSSANVAARPSTGSGRALGSGAGLGADRFGSGFGGGVGSGMSGGTIRVSQAAEPVAVAEDLGDLFQYKLKDPITIRKSQSALVPILSVPVNAEKVSIWNASSRQVRPQRGLWLTNPSEMTLDGGSFSVLEDGAFAGEGIVEPIRPGEKRLVSYATDLALTAGSQRDSAPQRVTRVRVARGLLIQERELREKMTYTFRNEDLAPRTVIVEHPTQAGFELRGEARPVETTPGWFRFRLQVQPKQTASLVVEQAKPLSASFSLSRLNEEQLGVMVRERTIDKALEDALRRILAQKQAVDGLETRKETLDREISGIFDDQQRLRENIKSLRGSAEEKVLLQRYTNQMNQQEDRLAALREQLRNASEELVRANAELDRLTGELVFDVRL